MSVSVLFVHYFWYQCYKEDALDTKAQYTTNGISTFPLIITFQIEIISTTLSKKTDLL
jgi:hypothetical protein